MAKPKVVQKIANRRHLETKGQETGQDSAGSPKREFFCSFFFSLPDANRLEIKPLL